MARRNLKRASKLRLTEAGGALEIVVQLKSALIWSWDIATEPISGDSPGWQPWFERFVYATETPEVEF